MTASRSLQLLACLWLALSCQSAQAALDKHKTTFHKGRDLSHLKSSLLSHERHTAEPPVADIHPPSDAVTTRLPSGTTATIDTSAMAPEIHATHGPITLEQATRLLARLSNAADTAEGQKQPSDASTQQAEAPADSVADKFVAMTQQFFHEDPVLKQLISNTPKKTPEQLADEARKRYADWEEAVEKLKRRWGAHLDRLSSPHGAEGKADDSIAVAASPAPQPATADTVQDINKAAKQEEEETYAASPAPQPAFVEADSDAEVEAKPAQQQQQPKQQESSGSRMGGRRTPGSPAKGNTVSARIASSSSSGSKAKGVASMRGSKAGMGANVNQQQQQQRQQQQRKQAAPQPQHAHAKANRAAQQAQARQQALQAQRAQRAQRIAQEAQAAADKAAAALAAAATAAHKARTKLQQHQAAVAGGPTLPLATQAEAEEQAKRARWEEAVFKHRSRRNAHLERVQKQQVQEAARKAKAARVASLLRWVWLVAIAVTVAAVTGSAILFVVCTSERVASHLPPGLVRFAHRMVLAPLERQLRAAQHHHRAAPVGLLDTGLDAGSAATGGLSLLANLQQSKSFRGVSSAVQPALNVLLRKRIGAQD